MEHSIAHCLRCADLPAIEARLLMQCVTGYTRVQLLTRDETLLTPAQWTQWQTLLSRRAAGEPIAYIVGEREFYGRMFAVNKDVLIPRADTETLVDAVLSLSDALGQSESVQGPSVRLLDLGTGSGAIAVTLAAERPHWQVMAVDISEQALQVARENANRYAPQTQLWHSDWFDALDAHYGQYAQYFDWIVSNPPYIAAEDDHLGQGDLRFEPRHALTDEADGLRHYRHVIAQAGRYLKSGGFLVFEHGFEQAAEVQALLRQFDFTAVRSVRDLAGHERVTLGQWQGAPKKDSNRE